MATGDDILTLAVQKLTDYLIQEATFLIEVKDDVKWLRRELIKMQYFLRDAEEKKGEDERIRLWLAEIRTIAVLIEDVIDDYYTEVEGKEPSKRRLIDVNVYDMDKEIIALKERLIDISLKRELYGINSIGSTQGEIANAGSKARIQDPTFYEESSFRSYKDKLVRAVIDICHKMGLYGINNIGSTQDEIANAGSKDRIQDPRRTTSYNDDEERFVGFHMDIKLLEEQLFSSKLTRTVIAIYGMDGLGKTSLVEKLYKTNKRRFELHAWVCVSQEWSTGDILERIMKSLEEPTYNKLKKLEKKDFDMEIRLRKLLEDKRYLVVINGVWDDEAWECLRDALPENQNGSRAIITTRSKFVVELSDERTHVHRCKPLGEDDSWILFCKNAFSNQNGACPKDLETIGKEMVSKCGGLPLAIIVLGGLLSRIQYGEWHVIKKCIWRALIGDYIHISALFDLSFNDLALQLKSCFLSLSFFPQDYEIGTEELVQFWIAEDMLLVQQKDGNPEELAESYIEELNVRRLIELRKNGYGSGLSCRVHYLLRDLAIKKAREQYDFDNYGKYPAIESFSTRRKVFCSKFEGFCSNLESLQGNIVLNHDFSQGLRFWDFNGCEGFIVCPDKGLSSNRDGATYAVITKRREKWQGVEQDITQRVSPNTTYKLSASVGVLKSFQGAQTIFARLRLVHEGSPSIHFFEVARTEVSNGQWNKLEGSFSLDSSIPHRVIICFQGSSCGVDILIKNVVIANSIDAKVISFREQAVKHDRLFKLMKIETEIRIDGR